MLETIVAKSCPFQSRHVLTILFEFFLHIVAVYTLVISDLHRFSGFLGLSLHLVEREYAFVVTEVALWSDALLPTWIPSTRAAAGYRYVEFGGMAAAMPPNST